MAHSSLTDEEIDAEIERLSEREKSVRHIIKEMQRDADALEIRQMNLMRIRHGRRNGSGSDWMA
jgi:hypothetical protein